MSWLISKAMMDNYGNLHSSQEQEAGFSEENYSDGKPSAQSSGNPTQLVYCALDKMTGLSKKRSLSGMTFKPLTDDLGEAVLMSFLEAFPVRTSPVQEKVQESRESDLPCGSTWQELSMTCVHEKSSSKIRHNLLWEEDLEPSSLTLPKWGMMLDGELWERTTLPRLTSGTGYGSWPTPCANEDAAGTPNGNMQKMLGNDPKVRGETPEEWSKGALSPDWVEWLMGWPISWTSLEPIGDLDWRDWKTDPADAGEIPRVATGINSRADRLKAIGNGQVPQVAAMAWNILNK